jgi:peptide/nickel transport system substrate-binding protein
MRRPPEERSRRRPTRIAAAVLLVAAAAALFAALRASAEILAKPTLTIGAIDGPGDLSPTSWSSSNEGEWLVYEAVIFKVTPNGNYAPGLATSWRFLPAPKGSGLANKRFEFTIRHDARYSDGTPVTAQTIKTYYEYVMKSPNAPYFQLGPVQSVRTIGKWTILVTMKVPNPNARQAMSGTGYGLATSPNCLNRGADYLSSHTCGAGPYMLDPSQTVTNDHYTFVPNPYYYNKAKQYWSKVVVKIIPTASSMLQALTTGQLDVAQGDVTTAAAAKRAGFLVHKNPAGNVSFVFDNGGRLMKAFTDVRVRRAFNYAIDRKTLAKAFGGEFVIPTSEEGTTDGYDPSYQFHYPYNPSKAKALLAAAGYAKGLTVPVLAYDGFGTDGTPLVQAIAKYMAAVGVTLNITSAATINDWVAQYTKFPLWEAPFGVDAMNIYYEFMHPPFTSNNWSDPTINHLWLKAIRAANATPLWMAMSRRATDIALFFPVLIQDGVYYVNSKKVAGVVATAKRPWVAVNEWYPAH